MSCSLMEKLKVISVEFDSRKCNSVCENAVIYEDGNKRLNIDDNGAVILQAKDEKLSFVKITFLRNFGEALVLSDAWERAYGELQWKKPDLEEKMPWYFIAFDGKKTFGYGVKTQPNALCFWQCDEKTITLTMDIRNGSFPLTIYEDELELCRIVAEEFSGDIYLSARDFCKMMCDNPRMVNRPVFGGNDWYCCYGDNSFDKIIEHTKRIVMCSEGLKYKPYMVIDDGWEISHHHSENGYEWYNGGPWKYCNSNFGDMKKTADTISEIGAIPGIWFRPLWTIEKFPSRYYLKHDGIKFTLDPSVPEVLEQVKSDVMCLVNWGYKLIKHDFSTFDIFGKWGFEMDDAEEICFHDKTKTTAQIIKNFYRAIREAAGEDVLVMGCNTMSHLSAGFFDIQRTGDDTSGIEWERTKKMGINTLAFRMAQHKAFYDVDADCVGITTKIPWDKNKQWLDVLARSATPLFVSIAEDSFTDQIKNDITEAFKKASENTETSKPVDWLETKTPRKWITAFGEAEYDF